MRRLTLRLLALGALALTVAAVVAWSHGDRDVSPPPTGERALPGLADKLDDLAWLRLSRGTTAVNFTLINRRWTVTEKGNYPADQDRVRQLLVQLAQLELIEPKTDKPELLARLDLDDPVNGKSTLVTVQDRTGGQVGQLIIGRRRPNDIAGGEAGVYVRRPGSDQAWLARGSFDLGGGALAWLDRTVLDIPPGRVATVVTTAPDGAATTVTRVSADLPFQLDGAPPDARAKDDAALAAPAGALDALRLDDVKPAAEQPIPESGVATAAFTTFDGLIVGVRLTAPEAGNWAAIAVTGFGKGEAEAKALNDRLSRWRFALPAERAKLLRTTLADLLVPRGS